METLRQFCGKIKVTLRGILFRGLGDVSLGTLEHALLSFFFLLPPFRGRARWVWIRQLILPESHLSSVHILYLGLEAGISLLGSSLLIYSLAVIWSDEYCGHTTWCPVLIHPPSPRVSKEQTSPCMGSNSEAVAWRLIAKALAPCRLPFQSPLH